MYISEKGQVDGQGQCQVEYQGKSRGCAEDQNEC